MVYMLIGIGCLLGSIVTGRPLGRLPSPPVMAFSNVVMGMLMVVAFAAIVDIRLTVAVPKPWPPLPERSDGLA
jgi:predicted MFS family arabinose efflux permease